MAFVIVISPVWGPNEQSKYYVIIVSSLNYSPRLQPITRIECHT